ncbi:MAG: sporulation protein YtfJ [Clostridia bacterium]|nr:sporulation protein YtfJ [Clostridia bacterium]
MKEKSAAAGILSTSIEKMKDLVDVSTIIGEPIKISETLQIIPVSKVSYGFASGGTDFPKSKTKKGDEDLFGGGGGAGVTITPVAFLVVNNGNVSIKYVNAAEGSIERAIGMVPDIVDKATDVIAQMKNKDTSVETAVADYMDANAAKAE